MKNQLMIFTASLILLSALASEAASRIHCRGVTNSVYEVVLEKGKDLTRAQLAQLPSRLQRRALSADYVSEYKMTIFRGEAVPQAMTAVGLLTDVQLRVFSLFSSEEASTYVDELSPRDISSTLKVDGRVHDMSCDAI